jgi:hypothetical protein
LLLGETPRVATIWVATGFVFTVKVPEIWPAGIVTVTGTDAAALLLVIWNVAPPGGAAVNSVKVAVEAVPPTTWLGLNVRFVAWALAKA